jgi:hypothetical protein
LHSRKGLLGGGRHQEREDRPHEHYLGVALTSSRIAVISHPAGLEIVHLLTKSRSSMMISKPCERPVDLNDIIDALEMQIDECSSFVNCETGQVETVSDALLLEVEAGDGEEPDLPAWQKGEWVVAKRIVSTNRFQRLPTKFEVHEWSIMQDFSRSVESGRIREELLRTIHGAGAFRNFKDTLQRHGIEPAWLAFRAEALKEIALNWCQKNHITWK